MSSSGRQQRDIELIETPQNSYTSNIRIQKSAQREKSQQTGKSKKRIPFLGWKIYFGIIALAILNSHFGIISAYFQRFDPLIIIYSQNLPPFIPISLVFDVLAIPLSLIFLIGLFGFSYQERIFSRHFWSIMLFVIIGWEIFYTFVLYEAFHVAQWGWEHTEEITFEMTVLFFLLYIPGYVGLYRYSHTEEVWKDTGLNSLR